MTSKTGAILGHLAMAGVTLALMAAGFVLVSTRADAFSTLAAAVTGPNLEIAAGGGATWGPSSGPAWTFTNGEPGETTTGTVRLRTLEAVPGGTALTLRAAAPNTTPGFADHLLITSMSLGGSNLLPHWAACSGGGTLTLQHLVACPSLSVRLPVPGVGGTDFVMAVRLDPAMGNAFQGASTGGVTFEFSLWSPADAGTGGAGTGTGGPGSGAPAPTATATTGVGGPGSGAPAPGATPRPPLTGFGWVPEEQRDLVGYGLISLGALVAVLLLTSIAAMTRRRLR